MENNRQNGAVLHWVYGKYKKQMELYSPWCMENNKQMELFSMGAW
jgi:hypothetical protein